MQRANPKTVSDEDIAHLNQLVKKAFNNPNAKADVKKIGVIISIYHVTIDHGFKGPINLYYIQSIIETMLIDIKLLSAVYDNIIITAKPPVADHAESYLIEIKNLSANHINGEDELTLIKSITRYLNNQAAALDTASPQLALKKTFSDECLQDLMSYTSTKEMIEPFPIKQPKLEGIQDGLILQMDAENRNTVFVKRFGINEMLAGSVFAIAQACGARVPQVSVHTTNTTCYLFSKHIAQGKENKQYGYVNLIDCIEDPNCYFDEKNLRLYKGRLPDGRFKSYYTIDKSSIARFLMIIVIFGINDTHGGNMGIVTSDYDGVSKAKLSLIDFDTHTPTQSGDDSRLIKDLFPEKSITQFIKCYVKAFSDKSEHRILSALSSHLTDDDYIKAFSKINAHFRDTYEQEIIKLDQLMSHTAIQTDVTKLSYIRKIAYERWINNFEKLRDKITIAGLSLKQPNQNPPECGY